MDHKISCPNCQRLLQMPEDHLGSQVRCPECQSVFRAEAPTGITANVPPVPPSSPWEVEAGPPPDAEASPCASNLSESDIEDRDDDRLERMALRSQYKPSGGLGIAVKVLFALNILMDLALLGCNYLQLQLANRLAVGAGVLNDELESNDARQLVLGSLSALLFLAIAIVFLVWFHRVHSNLKSLKARHLKYTSGWAVGCWFVPFLNLVRPVQIAQEIWRNSDPESVSGRENSSIAAPTNSTLIGFWWAMWLISNFISQISARMSWEVVNTPEALHADAAVAMIADVASIIAGVLALAVVSAIDARQMERAQILGMDVV